MTAEIVIPLILLAAITTAVAIIEHLKRKETEDALEWWAGIAIKYWPRMKGADAALLERIKELAKSASARSQGQPPQPRS